MVEWRIQKRVDEQFQAFVTGFNELIPPDLVNVFDERELELLIGGIADIDVNDWKKHTDYRGYEESSPVIQNFWQACSTTDGFFLCATLTVCSASNPGTRNRSHGSCNSQQALREYLSTDSRTCKEAMVHGGSRSRIRGRRMLCPSPIPGMPLSPSLHFPALVIVRLTCFDQFQSSRPAGLRHVL